MKVEFLYGTAVITLPADVKKHISRASQNDLRVLVALAAGAAASADALARACDISVGEVTASLAFWRGAGIIKTTDYVAPPAASAEPTAAPAAANEPAPYQMTGEEIERICSEHQDLKSTLDKCQQLYGKVFTYSEASVVVYLYDHLRLDCEYILLLCQYCVNHGQKSLRYFEKTALALYDKGIDSVEKLDDYISNESKRAELEYKVRKLFGFGERALTSKEKEHLNTWANEWNISFELVEAGYERMMANISEPKIHYENKILKAWHDAGINTVDEINEKDLPKSEKKSSSKQTTSSPGFDIDEFFKLAVERGKNGADENNNGENK